MTRVAAPLALCAIVFAFDAAPAAAQMQPGLWRFTQTTQSDGQAKTRTSTRCVSEAEAQNPVAYFEPRGDGCALTANSTWGGRITSTMRCVQGDETSEVTTTVRIESPVRISISSFMGVTSKQGRATVALNGSGERIGECNGRSAPQRR